MCAVRGACGLAFKPHRDYQNEPRRTHIYAEVLAQQKLRARLGFKDIRRRRVREIMCF